MTLEADIGCLRQLSLFASLPAPRLKLVALMGEKLHFEAGTQIVAEGAQPDGAYVVLQGEVEISNEQAEGRGRRFLMTTGNMIGAVPILCDRGYIGTISAKTEVSMLRLPRDLFFELLETMPDFSLALSRDLASQLYRLADFVLHETKIH